MKISIILGTRPEIIKMSPLIRECRRLGLDFFILHTGQHYSYEMDGVFFDELSLPSAKYNLDVGSGSQAEQMGRILLGSKKKDYSMKLGKVLVLNDTNTVINGSFIDYQVMVTNYAA